MRWFVGLLRQRCPAAEIRDLAPILNELRFIKSPREVELLRMAGKLSALGVIEAMRSTRPGAWEHQLDAVMRYTYLVNGARDAGTGPSSPAAPTSASATTGRTTRRSPTAISSWWTVPPTTTTTPAISAACGRSTDGTATCSVSYTASSSSTTRRSSISSGPA